MKISEGLIVWSNQSSKPSVKQLRSKDGLYLKLPVLDVLSVGTIVDGLPKKAHARFGEPGTGPRAGPAVGAASAGPSSSPAETDRGLSVI